MTDATQRLIDAAVEAVEMWDGLFNFTENRRRIDNLRTAIAAAQQEAAVPVPTFIKHDYGIDAAPQPPKETQ